MQAEQKNIDLKSIPLDLEQQDHGTHTNELVRASSNGNSWPYASKLGAIEKVPLEDTFLVSPSGTFCLLHILGN